MARQDDDYEQKLIDGWEEVFKKGQLILWIMLALKDGPKHMHEIKQFISSSTNGIVTADDQSMYRALRRCDASGLVEFTTRPGDSGPDKKIYTLSSIGSRLLQKFVKRNFIEVFYRDDIRRLLEK